MSKKNILLIEPGYKNKYPPLGLMKIAQYHGSEGKNDKVMFIKGENPVVLEKDWDRIYITTLFSFEFSRIAKTIDYALKTSRGDSRKIFVGGIAVSLMHELFTKERRWEGIRFITGLLSDSPAKSLQLGKGDFYSRDTKGKPIEDLIPNYDILKQIDYEYPVRDAYFTYASRGCVRTCRFCGVPKLEGAQRDTPSISGVVEGIAEEYGEKKDLVLMDNNFTASQNFREIVAEIQSLGFYKGARLQRDGKSLKRRVDFNQGVDARILCKNEMLLKEMSKLCISPLRIAFDHLGLRKQYEQSVRFAHKFGMNQLSNYMLYNFHDTPEDLFKRMELNIKLNEELGIRIWSFPMRYQPTNLPNRSHIGKNWTWYQLRSFQMVLQATHGVVSGSPSFFKYAFGNSAQEFREILLYPHRYIFHRKWFREWGGQSEFNDFKKQMSKLSEIDKQELLQCLSLSENRYSEVKNGNGIKNSNIRKILPFYKKASKAETEEIYRLQEGIRQQSTCTLEKDEFVEDAGLESND